MLFRCASLSLVTSEGVWVQSLKDSTSSRTAEAGEEFHSAREHSAGPQEPEFKLPKSSSPAAPNVGFHISSWPAKEHSSSPGPVQVSFVLQSTAAKVHEPQQHSGAAFHTVVAAKLSGRRACPAHQLLLLPTALPTSSQALAV